MEDKMDIKEKVKKLLKKIGCTADSSDDWLIDFVIDKVENSIKNTCNISIIPKMLYEIEVSMAAAEFLMLKKNSGQLNIENIDFEVMTKAITEGDTRVEFNTDGSFTPEQRFNTLVDYLLNNRKGDLLSYRCIKW